MISAQTLETLEYPKIVAQLARHAAFGASRDLALSWLPSTDPFIVRQRQRRTSEARRLLDDRPEVSIGGARDIRQAAGRARRGGVLEAASLLEVATTFGSMRRLRTLLLKLNEAVYPMLRELAYDLADIPAVEDAIGRAIGDDGGVLDGASPKLAQLRADVRIAFARLQDRLQSMVSSSQSESLQEPIITIRNGRYVLPVKASHRRNIRGLVHDQSASGATLYIEPMAVVELNNRWREIQLAEQVEIDRILAELSDLVGEHAEAAIVGVETLAQIDLALAMAKYSAALRCVEPEIVEYRPGESERPDPAAPPLLLTAARHPLLDQTAVVPTDLHLGGEFRLLLITGPNTGGKTVALKTTGLLALMAQSGMHIPASEPSRLPVFGQVFADIGDEQSIEQSLSTFSSHMTNIIRILRAIDGVGEPPARDTRPVAEEDARPLSLKKQREAADALENASNWRRLEPGQWAPTAAIEPDGLAKLVLLDELGAGTDPVEGAALARAVVERLLERDIFGVATTHYAELKAFAYATPGVQNASVEFNVETLAPTYRLTIGLPGRSNALAIATRLGLDAALVERARSTMDNEDAHVEDLLAGIHRERETAAEDRRRADELRADAEKYRERLADELQSFEARRDAEWEQARQEIESELREARSQVRRLRDDLKSVSVSRQWLEQAEQRINETRSAVPSQAPGKPIAPALPPPPAAQAPRALQVGDLVMVRSVGLMGEILSIDEEERAADVQVGGFRMRAELAELRRSKDGKPSAASAAYAESRGTSLPPPPDVSISIDMRGWRAAEVIEKLERYLNDAVLAGLPQVRIIHGKGTGALRQVVRDMLKTHPLVASFNSASQADGGEGVTVARLSDG